MLRQTKLDASHFKERSAYDEDESKKRRKENCKTKRLVRQYLQLGAKYRLYLIGVTLLLAVVVLFLARLKRKSISLPLHTSLYASIANEKVWIPIVRQNRPVDVPLRQELLQEQMYSAKPQLFDIARAQSSDTIPRIVHFIRFSSNSVDYSSWGVQWSKPKPKPLHLLHYLTLRAAIHRLEPQHVFFYCDIEPIGPLWHMVRPLVTIIYIQPEAHVFGNPIGSIQQLSDVLRMRVLMQHGGIYLGLDVIVLESFTALLDSTAEFIMGKEEGHDNAGDHFVGVCNAVLLGKSTSRFLRRWYQSYVTFDAAQFSDHNGKIPWQLSRIVSSDVMLLDPRRFFTPLWTAQGLLDLFTSSAFSFKDNFAVHLWAQVSWYQYIAYLSLHEIIAHDTSFHKLLRPLLPYPLFSILVYCDKADDAPSAMATMTSVLDQPFQLYDIVLGDSSVDSKCSTILQHEFIPTRSRLKIENGITIVRSPGASHKAMYNALVHHSKAPWVVETQRGETIHPEMLLQAQDYMVSNPGSYLENAEAFRQFKFRYMDSVRSSVEGTLPLPNLILYPRWYGPFPELNPAHMPLSDIHSGDTDVFSVVVIRDRTLRTDFRNELRDNTESHRRSASRRLRLHTVVSMQPTDVHDLVLTTLWPGKITAELYRSVMFNDIQRSLAQASEIATLLTHVRLWEKCVKERKPVLVLHSSTVVLDDFDGQLKLALNSLPLDFGLLYFGDSKNVRLAKGEAVGSLIEYEAVVEHYDGFVLSVRMAQMLLDGVFPMAMSLDRYMFDTAKLYRFRLFRTPSALVGSVDIDTATAILEPSVKPPRFVHHMYLSAATLWNDSIPGLPANGGSMMSGFQSVEAMHWDAELAIHENAFYSDLDISSPLFELKLLHLKVSILNRYGGIVIDGGFGSDRLANLPHALPMFWTVLHHHNNTMTTFPKIPFMAAPKQVDFLMRLQQDLHDIITGPERPDEKFELAIEHLQSFTESHTSSVPQGDRMVVFPVAILFE